MNLKKSLLLGAGVLLGGMLSAQSTQRTPLYETFTSSTCPPCNPGNVHLEELFAQPENEGEFTSLKYQMSWPGTGDPYYTAEGGSRRSYYGITSVPNLQVDGGFDANPTSLTQSNMDEFYAEPAVVELEAFYQIDEASQTVDIQIKAKALVELESGGGLFLHCAIFEKTTTGNVKTNGETQFEHVMKKMVPSATGTYMGGMDADEEMEFDLSYTFNGDYVLPPNADSPIDHSEAHSVEEFSDLGVVVWVQRSSTREVYQSTYATVGTVSIDENVESVQRLSLYPNPASDLTRIVYSADASAGDLTISVTDNTGKLVYQNVISNPTGDIQTFELDTKDFESGLYIVTMRNEEGRKTEKLSVQH